MDTHEATRSFGGDTSSIPLQRKYWAQALIDKAERPIPTYGSPEWLVLPMEDPKRVAACVIAAEAHARAGDTLEDDLRREIELLRAAHKRAEDAEYRANAAAHEERVKKLVGKPRKDDKPATWTFLERRARQLAAAQPRPDDYTGGPVTWDGGDSA